jgi:dolichol-phosphate mannosyltransferase
MALKTLIFIPTFNERENAPAMLREIDQLGLDSDILFIDDGSPDGTGMVLDELRLEYPRLAVRHRAGKLGIGSAHQEAIQWASDQGYAVLVTLDCDFTHSPSDIPYLIEATNEADVAIGSRWLAKDSLPGWNVFRRGMTRLGHLLTRSLLRLPHDATGAFRVYRLDRVEREVFSLIKSQGYAFFFESLFVLRACGATIAEIPIILPARTYGSSKMTTRSAWHSLQVLFLLSLTNFCHPERFRLSVREIAIDDSLSKPQVQLPTNSSPRSTEILSSGDG